jgi:Tfp pilus assembly protein PilF
MMKNEEKVMKALNRTRLSKLALIAGLLAAVVLVLPGCAMQPPVRDAGGGRQQEQPQEGGAAGTLLASAQQSVQAGQFSRAEMTLERALRVEPRNPRLWHEMAQVKFGQENFGQAVQFCLKSNSLAGKDSALIRKNWQLMARAYAKLGDMDKAEQAKMKAMGGN